MGQMETLILIQEMDKFESFEGWGAGYPAKKCGVQARKNFQDERAPPRGNVLQFVEREINGPCLDSTYFIFGNSARNVEEAVGIKPDILSSSRLSSVGCRSRGCEC